MKQVKINNNNKSNENENENGNNENLKNPSEKFENFEKNENQLDSQKIEEFLDFESMGLRDNLLRGIFAYGFEKPSLIQKTGIVPFVLGHDVVIQSQSGTGKTATYVIGLLQRINDQNKDLQGLILTPTRELAVQVLKTVLALGEFIGITARAVIGGVRLSEDISVLSRNSTQIVIGTPGRVKDLIGRNILDPKKIDYLVIDEADLMLEKGFVQDIFDIVRELPRRTQASIVSATYTPEVMEITTKIVNPNNNRQILVKKEELTLRGIQQYYVDCGKNDEKLLVLLDLYDRLSINQAIIFCNSKKTVDYLTRELESRDFAVSSIHAEKENRIGIFNDFQSGKTRVLISTDVMGRGIDIQQISVVVNFELPHDHSQYLHRIGRSGRFGRKGLGLNLITERDFDHILDIEKYFGTKIEELPNTFQI